MKEEEKELWAKIISDARWHDGTPQGLQKLTKHFIDQGIQVKTIEDKGNYDIQTDPLKCIKCDGRGTVKNMIDFTTEEMGLILNFMGEMMLKTVQGNMSGSDKVFRTSSIVEITRKITDALKQRDREGRSRHQADYQADYQADIKASSIKDEEDLRHIITIQTPVTKGKIPVRIRIIVEGEGFATEDVIGFDWENVKNVNESQ